MSLRTKVIVNPASGGGATGRNWARLRHGLDEHLGSWDEVFTKAPLHATQLARTAVADGYDQLVVVGGDGTLNEAVNGLFAADEEFGIGERPIRPDLRFATVRRGTGGDFARLLDLPGRGKKVFAHLGSDRTASLDLGLCTFVGTDGRRRRRAFANVASFGLSGLVDVKVNQGAKRFGALSFFGSTLAALLEYRRVTVRVEVDRQLQYEGPLVLGAVANGAYFGGGMRIAPDARYDDGQFEVVLLVSAGGREVIRFSDIYSGRHTRWPTARVARGRLIEASIAGEGGDKASCLLDLDGEQPGGLNARFELLEGAVQLVLP